MLRVGMPLGLGRAYLIMPFWLYAFWVIFIVLPVCLIWVTAALMALVLIGIWKLITWPLKRWAAKWQASHPPRTGDWYYSPVRRRYVHSRRTKKVPAAQPRTAQQQERPEWFHAVHEVDSPHRER